MEEYVEQKSGNPYVIKKELGFFCRINRLE